MYIVLDVSQVHEAVYHRPCWLGKTLFLTTLVRSVHWLAGHNNLSPVIQWDRITELVRHSVREASGDWYPSWEPAEEDIATIMSSMAHAITLAYVPIASCLQKVPQGVLLNVVEYTTDGLYVNVVEMPACSVQMIRS